MDVRFVAVWAQIAPLSRQRCCTSARFFDAFHARDDSDPAARRCRSHWSYSRDYTSIRRTSWPGSARGTGVNDQRWLDEERQLRRRRQWRLSGSRLANIADTRMTALCSKAARSIAASSGRLRHLPLSPTQRPASAALLVGTGDNAHIEWRVGRPLTDPAIIIFA